MMFVYSAEAGSKSEEALNLLASWTATLDQSEPGKVTDRGGSVFWERGQAVRR